ncbi:TPA: minor capsid protein [Streptococcus pneumoniae]|nr:minor capsid protein [Streptococcus pneumoniae]
MTSEQTTKNQRYNAERKAQAALMKRDVDRDAILTQLYQESFNRLQTEIDHFYMAYAGKEGLTKQDAMKRASEFDVTKFAEKAKKAVKEKDFSQGTNSWLRIYNLKMKVSRLELLKSELALEIQNLTSEVNEVFDKARREEYLAEYKRQAGILGISSKGANKRIQSILDADFYGQNFSSRVWGSTGLQATLQRDVFASLNRVYTDMMGYKQEMNRLSKKYGTSKENAKRLLKTEIARINADTQHAMLKANGFTHMIFVAEPGACDICGPLDKKAIPIDEVEKGVNMFPMHPNCRCSAYGHIKMDYKAGGSTLDEYELWDTTIETDDKKVYNQGMEGMYRKKTIDQSKMSKASQEQINRLSRKFRKRGGVFISDEDAIEYLDEKKAEAITLDPYTILKRDEISISALIEELEHAEQYLRNENDGTALSVAINELNAKRKSIEEKERYKLPKIEIDSVRKDIKYYEKEVERLTNENFKF